MSERPVSRFQLLRACLAMLPLMVVTIILAPLQWFANRLRLKGLQRAIPLVFHSTALWCMGVKVLVEGQPMAPAPVLMVGNHVSWLDIVILSTVFPARFVSKDDVALWPVFGTLARLQNTLFISRTRRQTTGQAASAMQDGLHDGDRLVLFAEGTSSDGGQVLPFRSALLGAVAGSHDARGGQTSVMIQPFALAYVRRDGLTIGRGERTDIGWFGDLDLLPSLVGIILGGPIQVALVLGAGQQASGPGERKQMARDLEAQVRDMLSKRLRQA